MLTALIGIGSAIIISMLIAIIVAFIKSLHNREVDYSDYHDEDEYEV